MITPNELVVPEDIKGLRYALVRAWREMVKKANYHLIQWRYGGTDTGSVGQVNKVNFTGAGVSSSVTDDTLTVTIAGGGGSSTDLDTTLSYNVDDTLDVVTTASGTKTMGYTGDKLTSIVGTGIYPSKNFTYTGDLLTGIDVL